MDRQFQREYRSKSRQAGGLQNRICGSRKGAQETGGAMRPQCPATNAEAESCHAADKIGVERRDPACEAACQQRPCRHGGKRQHQPTAPPREAPGKCRSGIEPDLDRNAPARRIPAKRSGIDEGLRQRRGQGKVTQIALALEGSAHVGGAGEQQRDFAQHIQGQNGEVQRKDAPQPQQHEAQHRKSLRQPVPIGTGYDEAGQHEEEIDEYPAVAGEEPARRNTAVEHVECHHQKGGDPAQRIEGDEAATIRQARVARAAAHLRCRWRLCRARRRARRVVGRALAACSNLLP